MHGEPEYELEDDRRDSWFFSLEMGKRFSEWFSFSKFSIAWTMECYELITTPNVDCS